MIYLIVWGRFLQYFSEFIDFVFTPLCEKDFGFQEKDLGYRTDFDLRGLPYYYNIFKKVFRVG